MSANNWGVCPKCLAEATNNREHAIKEAAEAYGKVSAEEWRAMSDAAHKPLSLEETMLEDYELGVSRDGKFTLYYGASCQNCDYEFSIRHEQSAMEPPKAIKKT